MKWRYLDTGFNSGVFNMQMDEALARASAPGVPVLRFFQWKPFCISLGKNQTMQELDADRCREESVDVVYRPTGGRAILHAEELTYSVIVPGDRENAADLYGRIGRALAAGLRDLNIPAELVPTQTDFRQAYGRESSFACFTNSARHEIQVGGKKLVGSAQRRLAGSILQHGSILTGPYHLRLPEFLNVGKEEKRQMRKMLETKTVDIGRIITVEIDTLKKALKNAFAETFRIEFESAREGIFAGTDARSDKG